ncbi:MAG: pyridoxal phosphate-dependent aminotransferase [Cellvibrionales bacterium]|nr:pyridoxal phosphate-dependent aminotransferase [Cellvibrionales bacterium]
MEEAHRLEEEGARVTRLNVGNPGAFDLHAPDEIVQDVIRNLGTAESYCESRGLFPARKAVMQECQVRGIPNVGIDDIFMGNGVSELIVMCLQALLNDGDEVLIPAPDYPLWTAAVRLCGGVPVHYMCDESSGWQPDLADLKNKLSPRTVALLAINPNNPTGALYEPALLSELANIAVTNRLVLLADEIYDKILYDGAQHTPLAALTDETLVITFNGLSKSYRLAGFRAGWAILSGNRQRAGNFIEGLNMLSSMRLCSNVPGQLAVQTALGGYQSIRDLILPGGRLLEQRNLAWQMLNDLPGVSCVKPRGAMYLFPKLDLRQYPIQDDEQFVLELLQNKLVLLVQGTAFNWPTPDHLRLVFLPRKEELTAAIDKFADFLIKYRA